MKIKKYVASSMPEAIKQIRLELGEDAVILNSKVVHQGGFLKFFRKKNIEVIAAVDHDPKTGLHENEKRASGFRETEGANHKGEQLAEKIRANPAYGRTQSSMYDEKNISSSKLLSEIHELKHLLETVTSVKANTVKYPQHIAKIHELLIRQEIDEVIRDDIVQKLLVEWYRHGASAPYEQVLSWCRDLLAKRISDCSYGGITFSKKFISVLGPTGVGKTTTLAKIAAECTLKYRKRAGFITTDTYRIAAIEQLKTYAKILGVPLEVCYDLSDFRRACRNFSDLDIIFIDTAGRNYRNAYYIKELENVIDFNEDMDTYLVLSLTSKQKDMEEVFCRFAGIPVKQFIFTKMDETSHIGTMYNMIDKYKKGVAYITNGQSVPDDIITASAEGIVKSILEVEPQ